MAAITARAVAAPCLTLAMPASATLPATAPAAPRVLILHAGIGHGHRVCAEGVAAELRAELPAAHVSLRGGLGAKWGPKRLLLERGVRWQLERWPRSYHVLYTLAVRWAPGRRAALALLYTTSRRSLLSLVANQAPHVIVSTYPGLTAPLGRLRQRAQLEVPLCALITDLASLHYWAHPGVDLHLAAYPESLEEIAVVSGAAPAHAVRPPLDPEHWRARDRSQARHSLQLTDDSSIVVISGGGWGIGDLRGAAAAALAIPRTHVVVVCGENRLAARRLSQHYHGNSRVHVIGYTTAMADLLRAADVLVHSTGGLTSLEAAAHGLPVVAYGFGYGHIQHNVAAMVRHRLATSAGNADELTTRLREALAQPRATPASNGKPTAASAVIALLAAPADPAGNGANPDPPRRATPHTTNRAARPDAPATRRRGIERIGAALEGLLIRRSHRTRTRT